MHRVPVSLKVLWTLAVWAVCLAAPYCALHWRGPVGGIVASISSYVFWLIAGEWVVGWYANGKRVYTAFPQAIVFYNDCAAIIVCLFFIVAH